MMRRDKNIRRMLCEVVGAMFAFGLGGIVAVVGLVWILKNF